MLAEMESNGAIKMAGAMYNLESGGIDFFAGCFGASAHGGRGEDDLDVDL